jgi:hypothetical protein
MGRCEVRELAACAMSRQATATGTAAERTTALRAWGAGGRGCRLGLICCWRGVLVCVVRSGARSGAWSVPGPLGLTWPDKKLRVR